MSDLTMKIPKNSTKNIQEVIFLKVTDMLKCDKLTDAARKGDNLADLGFGIEIVG